MWQLPETTTRVLLHCPCVLYHTQFTWYDHSLCAEFRLFTALKWFNSIVSRDDRQKTNTGTFRFYRTRRLPYFPAWLPTAANPTNIRGNLMYTRGWTGLLRPHGGSAVRSETQIIRTTYESIEVRFTMRGCRRASIYFIVTNAVARWSRS